MNLPYITHINLARGWRGGEHQTFLLMQELEKVGINQRLCAYRESPIADKARSLGIPLISPASALMKPQQLAGSIIHAHEARGVYVAAWAKYRVGSPYVVTRRMEQSPRRRMFTVSAYQKADQLVGISRAACVGLEQVAPGQAVLKIPSTHSNIRPDQDEVVKLKNRLLGGAKLLIGHAGALVDRHKGQSLLIDAFRITSEARGDLKLVIMGQGPDREILEEKAKSLNVEFLGHVNNIQLHLAALDCFVLPSRHEGLGSVLLEAMHVGTPVIAANVGGIPDVVEDKRTGVLVAPENAPMLAAAIQRVINDKAFCNSLIESASQTAMRHNPRAMAEDYIKVYREWVKS